MYDTFGSPLTRTFALQWRGQHVDSGGAPGKTRTASVPRCRHDESIDCRCLASYQSLAVDGIAIRTNTRFGRPNKENSSLAYPRTKHVPAKVAELQDPRVVVHQQVLRLDIAVTDPRGVDVRERAVHLVRVKLP
jgi:hypothetical protein